MINNNKICDLSLSSYVITFIVRNSNDLFSIFVRKKKKKTKLKNSVFNSTRTQR